MNGMKWTGSFWNIEALKLLENHEWILAIMRFVLKILLTLKTFNQTPNMKCGNISKAKLFPKHFNLDFHSIALILLELESSVRLIRYVPCLCLMIEIGYGFLFLHPSLPPSFNSLFVCVHSRVLFYCTQSLIQTRKTIWNLWNCVQLGKSFFFSFFHFYFIFFIFSFSSSCCRKNKERERGRWRKEDYIR